MDRQIMERWRKVASELLKEQDDRRREELIREMDRILVDAINGKTAPDPAICARKNAAA